MKIKQQLNRGLKPNMNLKYYYMIINWYKKKKLIIKKTFNDRNFVSKQAAFESN